ncbi:pseudouridine synthase [Azospirillum halopraeferens]|uniref:pseudouridine synthase n=1 Tax=Azospirillum halopraeferens TaxID=34010 RepID=UPI000420166B|nr:pseudouridine synthase [Azospirillum halopraeferens]
MDTPRPDTSLDPLAGDGDSPDSGGGERIAKRLARAGLCSRRDAERWIAEGRVAVNGRTLDSPACVVTPGDIVLVDGQPIPEPEPTRLWRYNKPAGLVTTARDEKGRSTVFEKLPADLPRVVSVGRLDLNTEGLLLLTNDGELARFLELPATGWTRRYRVRVHGTVDERQLAALAKGPTIEGVTYGPIEATLDRVQGSNAWLTVGIKEGKNREIRKVMESLGLQVTRLIRTAYGPFQLGKLEEGAVEEVPRRVVKDQVILFFRDRDGAGADAPSGHAKAAVRKPGPPRTARAKPQPANAAGPGTPPKGRAPARPGAAKPGGPKTGATKSGAAKPGPGKSGGAKPGPAKPGSSRPAGPRSGGGGRADRRR